MPKTKIAINEHYHIYNRGNNKQNIFFEERDYIRFLFLALYFQGGDSVYNIGRYVTNYVRHRMFNIDSREISKNKKVELLAFALMPNHFHFILKEKEQGGISKYLQRIQNSYTKYIIHKY